MCSRTTSRYNWRQLGGLFHKTTANIIAAVAAVATQTLRISAAAIADTAADEVPLDDSGDALLETSTFRTTESTTTTLHPSSTLFSIVSSTTTLPELGGEGVKEVLLPNITSTTRDSGVWDHRDVMEDRLEEDSVVEWTTWLDTNYTEAASPGETPDNSSTVAVAVGVTVVCLLICLGVALLVFFVIRRKKAKRKEKSIVKVENPEYRMSMDRRATTLEKSLGTAPTVNFQANSNKVSLPEGSNGSQPKRARGEAPAAPIYRPSKDGGMLVVGATKVPPERPPAPSDPSKRRHAPPAPPGELPITNSSSTSNSDLYEKDSAHGSMEQVENLSPEISSVNNPGAVTPPHRQISPPISPNNTTSNSPTEPLLTVNQRLAPPKPVRIITPSHTPVPSPRQRSSVRDSSGSQTKSEGKEEENTANIDDDIEDAETALLSKTKNKKKTESTTSLDSYDKTLNPFFAEDY